MEMAAILHFFILHYLSGVSAIKRILPFLPFLLLFLLLVWLTVSPHSRAAVEAWRMKHSELAPLPARPSGSSGARPFFLSQAPSAPPLPTPAPASEPTDPPGEAMSEPLLPPESEAVLETTITGGLTIKNQTGFEVDLEAMLNAGTPVRLPAEGVQILIIHTHSSEAYTQAGLDRYVPSDTCRTEDPAYNIIRVGDELTARFEAAGLTVLHDTGVYDYPSYTGSYSRSGAAIEAILKEHPEIAIVIDMHRDALGSGDVVYKTMAEEEGLVASQVMLLVGTDESGLEHPHWRDNLSLALTLQQAVTKAHPTLMRPVELVPQRYNTHLTRGSLILEVGSSGNTLQEALAAIRLFGDAAAPALLALVE